PPSSPPPSPSSPTSPASSPASPTPSCAPPSPPPRARTSRGAPSTSPRRLPQRSEALEPLETLEKEAIRRPQLIQPGAELGEVLAETRDVDRRHLAHRDVKLVDHRRRTRP